MKLLSHKKFEKQYAKLPKEIKGKFLLRIKLFKENQIASVLNIHQLKGDRHPLLSMNITGDYRALFLINKDAVTFYEIGTHSELYE
jgi:mRNA-degrading endonuclease YafQ of YafQ-DinJ toxin-antitoxin module